MVVKKVASTAAKKVEVMVVRWVVQTVDMLAELLAETLVAWLVAVWAARKGATSAAMTDVERVEKTVVGMVELRVAMTADRTVA